MNAFHTGHRSGKSSPFPLPQLSCRTLLTPSRLWGGLAVALLAAFTLAESAVAQLQVSVLPSNSQNRGKYGIAIKGQETTLFGRAWGGSGSYEYKWTVDGAADVAWHVPADGFDNHPSFNENNDFIPRLHTFPGKGPKIVTLSVKESGAADASAVSRSAEIDVRDAGEHEDEVNIAIEKALLYLYNSAIDFGAGRVKWEANAAYSTSATPAAVLSFAENGHLVGNDPVADIYAPTVEAGVKYITENGSGYLQKTTTSGVNDDNGNGIGAYTSWAPVYATGWTSMGVTFAYPSAAAAQAAVISAGPHAGSTIYEFVGDLLDQFYVSRNATGSWVYSMVGDGGRIDGSAQQWVALACRIAIDRWEYTVKQDLLDLSVLGFINAQYPDGGCGYIGPGSWSNAGMTGGSLVGFSLGNKWVADGDTHATKAADYIAANFFRQHTSNGTNFETFLGTGGDFYTMYGVKKGLAIHEIDTIDTPEASDVDWQREIDDWLLGKTTHTRWTQGKTQAGGAYGQYPAGNWNGNVHHGNYGDTFETSHGILLLNRGVTKALPVAEIVVASDTFAVGALFVVDGSSSYHADPVNNTIVSYDWDFEIGGETGTATGIAPVVPAALVDAVGVLNVTLTVTDNAGSTDSTDTVVNIVDPATTPVPPIAFAIPDNQAPNYEGRPGDTITLDGSQSYDPNDGDIITSWCWDLDGNGTYGDAADEALTGIVPSAGSACGETIDVVFNEPKTLTVGLQVTTGADGLTGTSVADVLLVFTESDLSVPALSAEYDELTNEATITASVLLFVDVDAAPTVDTRIRFFYGGLAQAVELVGFPQGQQVVVITIEDALTGGATSLNVQAVVDPDGQVSEFNEDNNTNNTTVSSNQPPVAACNDQLLLSPVDGCDVDVSAEVIGAGSSDPDGDALTYSVDVAGPYPVGTTEVTVTVTDTRGESDSCTATITVIDEIAPAITLNGGDITLQCGVDTYAELGASAADNCGVDGVIAITGSVTDAPGVYAIAYNVSDINGNDAVTVVRTVTVEDTLPPTVTCPADITLECNDLTDTTPANTGSATGTDICSGVDISFSDILTPGCGGTYTITRTWTATDGVGLTDTCVQKINVNDTIAPSLAISDNFVNITPPDAPISFTITTGDDCSDVTLALSANSFKLKKDGTRKETGGSSKGGSSAKSGSKSGSSAKSGSSGKSGYSGSGAVIEIVDNVVTVLYSGGVNNHIEILATATDACGNTTSDVWEIVVEKPAKGGSSKSGSSKGSKANEGVGNGVDGNTPGHDNNGGNDDPGNTPGNPGAKVKSDSGSSPDPAPAPKKGKKGKK